MFQKSRRVRGIVLGVALTSGLTWAGARAQTGSQTNAKTAKTQLFMLLPYETKAQIAARTGENRKVYWGTWATYGKKLADANVLAGGNALQSPSEAHILRSRNGKSLGSAGTYADTKEQITGYLLLNVQSMEEAQRWAADCPAVKNGGAVEIRPTVPTMAADMQ